jgi:hypothetical protein
MREDPPTAHHPHFVWVVDFFPDPPTLTRLVPPTRFASTSNIADGSAIRSRIRWRAQIGRSVRVVESEIVTALIVTAFARSFRCSQWLQRRRYGTQLERWCPGCRWR